MTLQALTDAERNIWMSGLEKAGRDGGYVKGTGGSGASTPGLPSPVGSSGGASGAASLLAGAVPSSGMMWKLSYSLSLQFYGQINMEHM